MESYSAHKRTHVTHLHKDRESEREKVVHRQHMKLHRWKCIHWRKAREAMNRTDKKTEEEEEETATQMKARLTDD